MNKTLLTAVAALLALAGMSAAANAQFPILRGAARTAARTSVHVADRGVHVAANTVEVAPVVAVNAASRASVAGARVARGGVAVARGAVLTAGAAAAATDGVVVQHHSAYGPMFYSNGAYLNSYAGATYGGSAYYGGGGVTHSSVMAHAAPVYGGTLGSGVNVQTRRVGVYVGR